MPADATDRRETIRAAYAESMKADEETAETADETPAEEVEAAAEEKSPAEDHSEEAAPEETPEQKEARERDEHGRFKASEGKAPAAKAPAAKAAPAAAKPLVAPVAQPEKPAPVVPTAPATKPPQSWSAAEREAWAKLPAEAQRAVLRREGEVTRVLQENAQIRKEHAAVSQRWGEVESFVRPFEGIFRSQGMEPMQGVASVVQTYAALHYGSPQQKASILANLLTQFSDVDSVNAVLSGQGPSPAPRAAPQPRPQQPVDVRAAIREELSQFQEQARQAKADRDWSAFEGSAPEFLDTPGVQESMQTVLDAAHSRGRNLTYEQAYDLALKMDPEIQAILQQRAAAAAVAAPSAQAPTARARTAAATVRSKPAGVAGDEVDLTDRRAVIARMAARRV